MLSVHCLPFRDDELLNARANATLGRFMAAYSQVEGVFAFIYEKLSNRTTVISDFYKIQTNREQIAKLTTLLEDLTDDQFDLKDRDILLELLARWKSTLLNPRNHIVHGYWVFADEPIRFYQSANLHIKAKDIVKALRKREEAFSVSDIDVLTENCRALRDEATHAYASLTKLSRLPGVSRHLVAKFSHPPEPYSDQQIAHAYQEMRSILQEFWASVPDYTPVEFPEGFSDLPHGLKKLQFDALVEKDRSQSALLDAKLEPFLPRLIKLFEITRSKWRRASIESQIQRGNLLAMACLFTSYVQQAEQEENAAAARESFRAHSKQKNQE